MRILLLVAVVLALVLIAALVLGYRHRVARNLERAAIWVPYTATTSTIRGGRRELVVGCALTDTKGNVYSRFTIKHLDGTTINFEQALFDAKQDAITNCATLNT